MDWVECSKNREVWEQGSRFDWPIGGWESFNCDAGFSYSDLLGGIAWLWTYPGDFILRSPKVNGFFELSQLHTGGGLSAMISFVVFVIALTMLNRLLNMLF